MKKSIFTILLFLGLNLAIFGQSLTLHGQGDFVNVASQPSPGNVNAFTISVWLKFGGNSNSTTIVGANSTNDIRAVNGKINAYIAGGAGNTALTLQTDEDYNDSAWHFVVLRRNGLNVELWIDGILKKTGTFTLDNAVNYKVFALGQRGTTNAEFFKGSIKGVRLFNTAISNALITTLFNNGVFVPGSGAETNLVAGWNLQEGSGTSLADFSGNNKTGTLNNSNSVYSNWLNVDRATAKTFYVSQTGNFGNTGASFAAGWSVDYMLSHPPELLPGDTVILKDGLVYAPSIHAFCQLTGTAAKPIIIRPETQNAYPPTVTFDWQNIPFSGEGILFGGKHYEWWDLQIKNSNPDRLSANDNSPPTDIKGIHGAGIVGGAKKLVNFIVHDNSQSGVTCFDPNGAVTLKNFIVFANGWNAPARSHGHGLYYHNEDPLGAINLINYISLNPYYYTIQVYGTQTNTPSYNFNVDGAISGGGFGFALVGKYQKQNNVINKLYAQNAQTVFGQLGEINNDLTVTNSVMGQLAFYKWQSINFNNNIVYSDSRILTQRNYTGNLANYVYNNNSYYSAVASPFQLTDSAGANPVNYSWTNWKNLGFDSTSTLQTTTQPTTNFVKYLSDAETNRGYFAIYNFQNLASVNVDFSQFGLVNGQTYTIYNLENPFVSFATGTYNAASPNVAVSTVSNGVYQRVNDAANTPATRLPLHGAFLVIPGNAAPGAPNAPSLPTSPTKPAVSVSSVSIQFNWVDNSNDETNFLVRYRVGNGAWTTESVPANTTTLTKTGLNPGVTYEAQIAAVNANGQSPWVEIGFVTNTVIKFYGSSEPR